MYVSAGYEQITVSTVAKTLTIPTPVPREVAFARLTLETAPVRFRLDGTAPTAAIGELWQPGKEFQIDGLKDLANFKAIRQSGTDAVLSVHYFRDG